MEPYSYCDKKVRQNTIGVSAKSGNAREETAGIKGKAEEALLFLLGISGNGDS